MPLPPADLQAFLKRGIEVWLDGTADECTEVLLKVAMKAKLQFEREQSSAWKTWAGQSLGKGASMAHRFTRAR
eukprot:2192085-Pyramimonas_sp.AAC.1